MTNDAIIGHSGFVGGTLVRQHAFKSKFNRANINEVAEAAFDSVVCAAAPGSMFVANRYPDRDREAVERLIDQLSRVRAKRFVLISSIAVLADFASGADESTNTFQEAIAYGHHRRILEAFCEAHFDNCLVVRLPALFGWGLKKNFVFDLMNPIPSMLPKARLDTLLDQITPNLRNVLKGLYLANVDTGMMHLDRTTLDASPQRRALDAAVRAAGFSAIQFHHPDTTYQYYDMARLWRDIEIASEADLRSVHLAVAPLRAADIHTRLLGVEMPDTSAKIHHEDMRTLHAAHWDCEGPYLEESDTVLNKLAAFYNAQQANS